jgi:hypothetical protein
MASPIRGTVDYQVDIYNANPSSCTTPSGIPISTPVDLAVSVDLGTSQANVTYQPAPKGV